MNQRKKILFVCTGNTCRSPMAEGLFLKLSAGHPEWLAGSAGTAAWNGQGASPETLHVLNDHEVDLSGHASRAVTLELVEEATDIYTMTESHLAAMLAKAVAQDPTAAPVFAMLEAATLGGARALRWDADIGSLEIGKAADLFAIDLGTPESLPVADPAAQILYSAGRECITHTWVDGRLIMEKHARAAYPQTDALAAAALCAQKWQSRLKN